MKKDNSTVELKKLVEKFVKSYTHKPEDLDGVTWLKDQIKSEINGISDEEAERMSIECFEEVEKFNDNLKYLNDTYENGGYVEVRFAEKLEDAAKGMSINEYTNYLKSVDDTLVEANRQMIEVVKNTRGNQQISQNMNLDGFIAEQYHVGSFNANSQLSGEGYKARVLEPKPGEGYKKNSVDIVIEDKNGNIVHRYQGKYGKTAKDTINMIKKGNYNNQRILVPEDQVEEVRKAFPNKSISGSIGGTDKVKTKSNPLSKEEAKELQKKVQTEGIIPTEGWNSFTLRQVASNIGKNACITGAQAAAITVGADVIKSMVEGETIEADEVVYNAMTTAADVGVKAAATGATVVAIENGIIKVLPKGTPVGTVANVVCVGIENVKIAAKVANGELTVEEGMDAMGRTTSSMALGLAGAAKGAAICSVIPVIGPVVGGVVGGTIGYMAGSKFGEKAYEGAKKIGSAAKSFAEKTVDSVKSGFSKVSSGVKSIASKASNFCSGLFSRW